MRVIASFFPLKWMAQGMRSVFLPEQAAALEPAGQLGARAHRAGPGGLDSGRIGAVREDVPLAVPRLMPDQPRPSAPDRGRAAVGRLLRGGPRRQPGHRPGGPAATAARRIIATAALAAMVPWYIFLGRPLMKQDTATEPRATIYLAGLVVLFAIAQSQAANAWFLAFGLLPMCFHVTTARRALAFVVIINVIGRRAGCAGAIPGCAGALTALGIAGLRGRVRVRVQPLDGAGDRAEPGAGRAHRAAGGDPGRTRRGAPRGRRPGRTAPPGRRDP